MPLILNSGGALADPRKTKNLDSSGDNRLKMLM
jgi:hypothetical protein